MFAAIPIWLIIALAAAGAGAIVAATVKREKEEPIPPILTRRPVAPKLVLKGLRGVEIMGGGRPSMRPTVPEEAPPAPRKPGAPVRRRELGHPGASPLWWNLQNEMEAQLDVLDELRDAWPGLSYLYDWMNTEGRNGLLLIDPHTAGEKDYPATSRFFETDDDLDMLEDGLAIRVNPTIFKALGEGPELAAPPETDADELMIHITNDGDWYIWNRLDKEYQLAPINLDKVIRVPGESNVEARVEAQADANPSGLSYGDSDRVLVALQVDLVGIDPSVIESSLFPEGEVEWREGVGLFPIHGPTAEDTEFIAYTFPVPPEEEPPGRIVVTGHA